MIGFVLLCLLLFKYCFADLAAEALFPTCGFINGWFVLIIPVVASVSSLNGFVLFSCVSVVFSPLCIFFLDGVASFVGLLGHFVSRFQKHDCFPLLCCCFVSFVCKVAVFVDVISVSLV